MAITTALTLYDEAKKGKALTTSERRAVIYFLQATEPDKPLDEIAELFSISLKKLNKDRLEIRKRVAEEVKQTTVDMVIGEVHDAVKKSLRKLENNVAKLEERKQQGTDTFTRAATAMLDGWTKYYKIAQEMGIAPKETEPQVTTEYHWIAGVDDQGKAYTEQKVITKEVNGKEKVINVTNEANNLIDAGPPEVIPRTESTS